MDALLGGSDFKITVGIRREADVQRVKPLSVNQAPCVRVDCGTQRPGDTLDEWLVRVAQRDDFTSGRVFRVRKCACPMTPIPIRPTRTPFPLMTAAAERSPSR